MMRIAITGITGLVGASLANMLADQGHNVYGLVREDLSVTRFNSSINKIFGNINSFDDVKFLIERSQPDYIFHLAAQTQAHDSLSKPYESFYTNLVGTLNVLEVARVYGKAKAIVVASTDKAYGELDGIEYLESTPLNGIYPYDASKVTTETVAKSYRATYDMPVVVTRACNVYGPGDNNLQRLIPGVIKAYLYNEDFTIRNAGQDIREYVYVDDVADAYIKIAKHVEEKNLFPAFNISSGERASTIEVFYLIEQLLDRPIKHHIDQVKTKEIKHQAMNSNLLRTATGWEPRTRLKDGIAKLIPWYLENIK